MLWLAQQGMRVLGVEVSPIAVESFLAENHLHARTRSAADGTHYKITNTPAGGIEIINGDVFAVDATRLANCAAFYDRAATIALPVAQRERLTRSYAKLPKGSRGLLIVLDYPSREMEGPPFSVDETEVRRLFESHWAIGQLERRDILASQSSFSESGVTALHTAVYVLRRNATTAT
jgi:thiopurine S-methyltransferase